MRRSWRDVAAKIVPRMKRRGERAAGEPSRGAPSGGGPGGGPSGGGPRAGRPSGLTGQSAAQRAIGERLLVYAPQLDGEADPGEVVWTWVPYEDDPRQGKDRPVLVVGRRGGSVLGLMLSSNDRREGQRHWMALGVGAWDNQERPSWVRLDRVLEIAEDGIRREGTVLDRRRFDAIAVRLRADYAWS